MIITLVIGLITLVVLPSITWAAEFHVATTGDDANPGTSQEPFATPTRARDAARSLERATREEVTVWLHGGIYPMAEGLRLTVQDSGSDAAPTTYCAVPGEEVRLTGGQEIPTQVFQPVTDAAALERLPAEAHGHVLQAELTQAGIHDFGTLPVLFRGGVLLPELFCDGQAMTLARWPNDDWVWTKEIIERGSIPREGDRAAKVGTFVYEGDRPSRWLHATDMRLHGYWCFDWYDESVQIGAIDTDKQRITLAQPVHYGLGHSWQSEWARRYYAYNLLEELDEPGEWYLDRDEGVLYFWPPRPIEECRVSFSMLEVPVISVEDASHVVLQGITIEEGRGSGIRIQGGAHNRVLGCTVRNTGQDGIQIEGGQGHIVRSCDIYQTGTSGLRLSGGDRKTLTPAGHAALNNHIHHFARRQRTYAAAIHIGGVGNRLAHNLLHDGPHSAILLGGNDHVIELNEIHHMALETGDCGAFYMGRNPSERGTIIRFNYWHHIGSDIIEDGIAAIYFDDGAGGNQVIGNVFYRAGNPRNDRWGTCFVHGGHDNTFESNLFIECVRAFGSSPWNNQRWQEFLDGELMDQRLRHEVDITQPPYTTRYPDLVGYFDAAEEPRQNHAHRNVLYQCGALATPDYDEGDNLVTDDDPGFVDAAAQDFRLKQGSTAHRAIPDLVAIPFEQIGLRLDAYRRELPEE